MNDTAKLTITDTHILEVCCRIEEALAHLYRYFSELYADQPQMSALWEKTAKEEDNHAEQFRLACRLRGIGIKALKKDISRVNTVLEKIQYVYSGVQKIPPKLEDALKFAIRLEHSLADYHMNTIATFDDKGLALLFTSMMKHDRSHIEMLEKAYERVAAI